jgi:hypothetical protein
MSGKKRVLGADGSDETPSQSSARAKKPERQLQAVSAHNTAKAEIKRKPSVEEVVVQCPASSSSRPRSVIQRTSTLPPQHPPRSPNNAVQRSKTAPELDSRPVPSTPRKKVREPTSNVRRSRAISISTDGSINDDEAIPPSPATDVSCSLSPTFGDLPLPPPRYATPSRSSPARRRDKDDVRQNSHRLLTARSARGHTGAASPFKKAANTAGGSAHSTTRRGTSRRDQSPRKVVRDSSPSPGRLPSQRDLHNAPSHTPRDRSGGRPPPSPGGTSQLTYVSDDERPAGGLTRSTDDSDYQTPSSRNSEVSEAESEAPALVFSSGLKRKGKHRASPPPPSPFPRSSPSSFIGSSPRCPKSVTVPSPKKRRDRHTRPPSPWDGVNCRETRERTPAQDPNQSFVQDACHCAGPCPSCHKPRVPLPPHYPPSMFHPVPYPYPYFPPPYMQTGYQFSQYGPPSYPYPPYVMPQQTDHLPSISSAQPLPSGYPMHPPPATHSHATHPASVPVHTSPTPAPAPTSTPAPEPSASTPTPSPSVCFPPVDPPATGQVSPELLNALGQFYQPLQRPVKIIDPSCDPRSPYSKMAVVPASPNR